MSLLLLSFDSSSDSIGRELYQLLNASSKSPPLASFCSSEQLFASSNDYEKIFFDSLKTDFLSSNDLLGFLLLIDIATTNKLHLQYLSSIQSLLDHLTLQHPFQSILSFIIHASPNNQLYTSALTSFNLNLIFSHLYPFVHGIIFQNIDQINDHQIYHSTIAEQIGQIFLPISSLRENSKRLIRNVSVEFLQLIQHLLNDPEKKILIIKTENLKKSFHPTSNALLFIQRGQPTAATLNEIQLNNLDIWNSYEKHLSQLRELLIVNNDQLNRLLLEQLIIKPYEKKSQMNRAYFHWLKKKFPIENLENLLHEGILLCEKIISD